MYIIRPVCTQNKSASKCQDAAPQIRCIACCLHPASISLAILLARHCFARQRHVSDTAPPENETEKRATNLPGASCRHAGDAPQKSDGFRPRRVGLLSGINRRPCSWGNSLWSRGPGAGRGAHCRAQAVAVLALEHKVAIGRQPYQDWASQALPLARLLPARCAIAQSAFLLFPGRPPSLPDEGTHGRRRGTFLLRTT